LFDVNVDEEQITNDSNLRLVDTDDGLMVEWLDGTGFLNRTNSKKSGKKSNNNNSSKPLKLKIDIQNFVDQQQTFPAPKQGALNQALGKKTRHVVDATAGWAGDALLMCAQGYQVTLIERDPLMALLLTDAMQRLTETVWFVDNEVTAPVVINANAIGLMFDSKLGADCIYLDPMFPAKKKKYAAVNKYMQFLQCFIGKDTDADDLLSAALNTSCPRVAVKRPNYAKPLMYETIQPNTSFSSKLVHYDVYLSSQIGLMKSI